MSLDRCHGLIRVRHRIATMTLLHGLRLNIVRLLAVCRLSGAQR